MTVRFKQFIWLVPILAVGMVAMIYVGWIKPNVTPDPLTPVATATVTATPTAISTPIWSPQSVISRTATTALDQRRYVAAGDRAYVIGAEDGSFPAMGSHISGQMGGVWTQPIRLFSGYWFALDGKWLPEATSFTRGAGYINMDFPAQDGLQISRTEFAPNNMPVVLVGLTLTNNSQTERDELVNMDMLSDIRASYPWDSTNPNSDTFNNPDLVDFGRSGPLVKNPLLFQEQDKSWYALVATSADGAQSEAGHFTGPVVMPSLGKSASGRLSWHASLKPGEQQVYWVAFAGSHRSRQEAEQALSVALADPLRLFSEKNATREALLAQNKVTMPDQALQDAFDWSKLNLADLNRSLSELDVRQVNQGAAYPSPTAVINNVDGISAGLPDYPSYFANDGAYSVYGLIASGQWDLAKAHLRAIHAASVAINGSSGKVVHEVATDGSVYYGANQDPGNTNETAQFANAVDLVWRWTGDNAFRDEMYDFIVEGMRYLTTDLDTNNNGCPTGSGMVEAGGMSNEKLDVSVYTWQALGALERMAKSKNDSENGDWATGKANSLYSRFDNGWWIDRQSLYADSSADCAQPIMGLQQHYWTSATPMESDAAAPDHAALAFGRMESPDYTGAMGLYHTGADPGGYTPKFAMTLPTSVIAVAEATYGRLGNDQALRYMHDLAAQLDTEMPGALPENINSPGYNALGSMLGRGMFMQAWTAYGAQWPVISDFLGIDPDIPNGTLKVVPQLPTGWPSISASDMRVGTGVVSVDVTRSGNQITTKVVAESGVKLIIGYTLPTGTTPASVTLDNKPANYQIVNTTRGAEVQVETDSGSERDLVVTTK